MDDTTDGSVNGSYVQHELTLRQYQSPAGDALEDIMAHFRENVKRILDGQLKDVNFLETYSMQYIVVGEDFAHFVYADLIDLLQNYVVSVRKTLISMTPEESVQHIITIWVQFSARIRHVDNVCCYLTRNYCEENMVDTIPDYAFALWHKLVFSINGVSSAISTYIRDTLTKERDGLEVDRYMLRSAIEMLAQMSPVDLRIYRRDFEQPYIEDTFAYYSRKREELLASRGVIAYLRFADQTLLAEHRRMVELVHQDTRPMLRTVLIKALVGSALRDILNPDSGLGLMLEHGDVESARTVWVMLKGFREYRAQLHDAVGTGSMLMVRRYVEQAGDRPAHVWMQELVVAYARYMHTAQRACELDPAFIAEVSGGAQQAFAGVPQNVAVLVAYADWLFRRYKQAPADRAGALPPSSRTTLIFDSDAFAAPSPDTAEGMLRCLHVLVDFFRGVTERDVFEERYREALTQRLLTGATQLETETQALFLIRHETGPHYTQLMDSMLQDVRNSAHLATAVAATKDMAVFSRRCKDVSAPTMVPLIMTPGPWMVKRAPAPPTLQLNYMLRNLAPLAERTYLERHPGRKLEWCWDAGVAVVAVEFACGLRELQMTTYQYMVLDLFDEKDSLSFATLLKCTGVPEDELARHVLSLAHPKVGVLLKEPNTPAIAHDHVFKFNNDFRCREMRVRIPLMAPTSRPSAAAAGQPTNDAIVRQRKTMIQACIMRLLKIRKECEYALIMSHVEKSVASSFPLDNAIFKQCLEDLCDQEFIERDEDQRSVYRYLA